MTFLSLISLLSLLPRTLLRCVLSSLTFLTPPCAFSSLCLLPCRRVSGDISFFGCYAATLRPGLSSHENGGLSTLFSVLFNDVLGVVYDFVVCNAFAGWTVIWDPLRLHCSSSITISPWLWVQDSASRLGGQVRSLAMPTTSLSCQYPVTPRPLPAAYQGPSRLLKARFRDRHDYRAFRSYQLLFPFLQEGPQSASFGVTRASSTLSRLYSQRNVSTLNLLPLLRRFAATL